MREFTVAEMARPAKNGRPAARAEGTGRPAAAVVDEGGAVPRHEALIIETLVELTKYPREILVASAHLEEDLGIDSVKRAEIVGALAGRMGVPAQTVTQHLADTEPLQTIGELIVLAARIEDLILQGPVVDRVREHSAEGSDLTPDAPAEATGPPTSADDVRALVIEAMAELTRYPEEILVEDAELEEDLGIDSIKRAEILTTLRRRLGITSEQAQGSNPTMPRTVGEVVELAQRLTAQSYVSAESGPAPAVAFVRPSGSKTSFTNPSIPFKEGAAPTFARASTQPSRAASTRAGERATPLFQAVVSTLAVLTRHPSDIFEADAELDADLGINRATVGAALSSLGAQFDLPAELLDDAAGARTVMELTRLVADACELRSRNGSSQGRDEVSEAHAGVSLKGESVGAHAAILGATLSARPFEGRLALVTGSGHGLGKVIASQLAELGATVVVNSFYSRARGEETVEEINRAGGRAVHVWGSVANPAHVRRIFGEIEERFGYLDFYVQNASNGVIGPLEQVTEEHWDRAFRTNVVGFHQCAYLAAELMRRRAGGRIVALSSPGAHRYLEYFGCLGPVKAAVESLALYLAMELGKYNVQVNVVSAGPVYGERLTNYPDSDRLIPYWEGLSVDGRLGDAREISNNVIHLLSPAARKINGAVLLIDGAASQRM